MDWKSLLTTCLTFCVPISCFAFIGWYSKRAKKIMDEKSIENINEYLLSYFTLCMDPITFTFQEEKEYLVSIETNVMNPKDMNDIFVYINGGNIGTFYDYLYEGKHFFYEVYQNLKQKSHQVYKRKKDDIYTQLGKYAETIENENIHYGLLKLNQNLMIQTSDHAIDKKMENLYLPILCDILEIYHKLESSDQLKDAMYTKRCIDILHTLNSLLIQEKSIDKQVKKS